MLDNIILNLSPIRGIFLNDFLILLIGFMLPLIIGYILTKLLGQNKKISFLRRISFFIIFSFMLLIPTILMLNKLNNLSQCYSLIYYGFYFSIVCIWGSFFAKPAEIKFYKEDKNKSQEILIFTILFLFLLLSFLINYSIVTKSKYLVGADVYYTASRISLIDSENKYESSFFRGVTDYYYPPGYFFLANTLLKNFNLDITNFLPLFASVTTIIFLLIYYYYCFSFTKSKLASIISIFFILTWDKLLFIAISPKNLGIILILTFLYGFITLSNRKRNIILFLIALSTLVIHPEYFLIEVLICFIYLIVNKTALLKKTSSETDYKLDSESIRVFAISILLCVLVLLGFIVSLSFFQAEWKEVLVNNYSEIPFSIFNRIGFPSFLILILTPFALRSYYKSQIFSRKSKILNLSICLLVLNSIFYYAGLFNLHHSLISEISYVFGFLPITSLLISDVIRILDKKNKIIFLIICSLLVLIPLSITLKQRLNYQNGSDNFIDTYEDTFKMLRLSDPWNSVILARPCDYVNRLIPFFTHNFIFYGDWEGNENCPHRIVTICGTDKLNLYHCNERKDLAYTFFENPNTSNLDILSKKYKVDYLLIEKSYNLSFFSNISRLNKINESDTYILFKIN